MTRGRAMLVLLLIWALMMIIPDLARVVRPLSSFGFFANNNGLIYDVTGPFYSEADSPAWRAGVRTGDRIDLTKMRCFPYDSARCAATLAALGGNLYVTPGRTATIDLAATADRPARQVTLTAEQRPATWVVRGVLLLDQLAGIAVVLAAAWLVWTRPGPMSWGFFLYVVWFNPGQSFEFYAQLQRWPLLLVLQNFLGCFSQAAGYAGLLLFVVRAPTDVQQPGWAGFERSLPFVAAVIAIVLMAAYGTAFGFETEMLMRATILFGLVVSVCAFAILMLRRQTLSPKDNQRLRWVMWGCLIGLPVFVLADLSEYTTLFNLYWGGLQIPEDVVGLLYLVNGILCLFVFEAVRRPRVVNVAIPLRRVTLLAMTMSVPALLLHQQAEHLKEDLDIPRWGWLLFGAGVIFLIGRLHEVSVDLADRFFNRQLDKAELELGEAILQAKHPEAIDRLLSDGPLRTLKLSSAVTFRRADAGFFRGDTGAGWEGVASRDLRLDDAHLATLLKGSPRSIDEAAAKQAGFPPHIEGPLLAVPAANRAQCYAISLYGPHECGTAIDTNEREILISLGHHAADAYARLENEQLRETIATLQKQVATAGVPA
ncbi:MAG TPA: hypothetical protein VIF13_01455 [Hyphomicrobium sp.]